MKYLPGILLPLKHLYLVILVCMFFGFGTVADSSEAKPDYQIITQTLNQTQQEETIRYNFTQEKIITLLSRPLISTGFILHDKTHGMYMEYRDPVWTAYLITDNDIFEKLQENGSYRKLNLARRVGLSKILESVVTADIQYLRDYFSLVFSRQSHEWTLKLKPRSSSSSSTLNIIILKGDSYLRSLELVEHNGDRTFLRLTPASMPRSPITAKEINYFSH